MSENHFVQLMKRVECATGWNFSIQKQWLVQFNDVIIQEEENASHSYDLQITA